MVIIAIYIANLILLPISGLVLLAIRREKQSLRRMRLELWRTRKR